MSSSNPIVVVPIHKSSPSKDEAFSLKRCHKLLGCYPISIVYPFGLNLSAYSQLLPSADYVSVPTLWMKTIRAYNRMMINPAFYELFSGFSHILIHEPDALVLTDKLHFWCDQDYDYIGAPWFEGFTEIVRDARIIGVGNSGFSLLRLSSFLTLINSNYRWIPYPVILSELIDELARRYFPTASHLKTRQLKSIRSLILSLGRPGRILGAHTIFEGNFDEFLMDHVHNAVPSFSVAPVASALGFSWENHPRRCRELNNGLLPFGIHAWTRYDRPYIEKLILECGR